MLSHAQIKKFYDAFGQKQDKQFYEAAALHSLTRHGGFATATSVIEFGCGTGRLAAALLAENLPDTCQYTAMDISQTMIELCEKNTDKFKDRVTCRLSDGSPKLPMPDQSIDRFIATYVLDLLSEDDAQTLMDEAHRVLLPGGLILLACLTYGTTPVSRLVQSLWSGLYALNPNIVGGCRPISLTRYVNPKIWQMVHNETIVSYGVPSEVLVARKDAP
jgi:ubiquinone/menaquinone biosynthesis C-methylase UbiE